MATNAVVILALGVAVGILVGVLGTGPSILTVLLLTHVAGFPMSHAVVTSLAVVAATSLVALVPHVRAGNVSLAAALRVGVPSMVASYATRRLAADVSDRVMHGVLAGAMMVAALALIERRPERAHDAQAGEPPHASLVLVAGGLAVGAVTGLVGLGGGFAVVPLLVLFARTPVRIAIGTSIAVIALNTLAGLAANLPRPPVDVAMAVSLGAAESAGSLAGALFGRHVRADTLRVVFAGVMLAGAAATVGTLVHV